jgi:hypothetical protein
VLSTPPAFVLSQDQTLQTKTNPALLEKVSQKRGANGNHQRNLTKKHATPQHGDAKAWQKNKNNKQKPPNTLLSSQTTHPSRPRIHPTARGRVLVVRTTRRPPKWLSLWDAIALGGLAASRRLHQVT